MIYLGNQAVGVAGIRDQSVEAALIDGTITGVYRNEEVTAVAAAGLRERNFTRVEFPNCTMLKDSAFRYCSNLETLYLPKAYNVQYNYVFGNCNKLQMIVLPALSTFLRYDMADCPLLATVDIGKNGAEFKHMNFANDTSLNLLILRRYSSIVALTDLNVFNSTPFASGGTGGTIYIPKALYDHLGDGTSLDYKAATNWSTVDGYGTITWAKIEGTIYETQYADGTPVTE